ncbi:MAG TPA: flavodoxin family protein [Candidatus Cloacimonetes bacterium]|nr:flavodoxin family protein [Candidatus Cloacimonadota bacterium]HEX38371.1 flavodoxin family protein [Candidatus Cloacimonadota bacterium]
MKIVAFNGSPHKEGNTYSLLKIACETLEDEGIHTEILHLGGKQVHGCLACRKCFENKDNKCIQTEDIINTCIQKMVEADGMLIGSPTYFADVTPEVKALIDRAGFVGFANNGLFKRKLGAAVVAVRRAGAIHVFDSINHFFLISQMIIPGSSYWNLGVSGKSGTITGDEEGIGTMTNLGKNMAWLLKKIYDK